MDTPHPPHQFFKIVLILISIVVSIASYSLGTKTARYMCDKKITNLMNLLSIQNGQIFAMAESECSAYLASINQRSISNNPPEYISLPTGEITNTCNKYGLRSKEGFLRPYLVQEGDTLLSIANQQMQDISAVNNIIQINKTEHPTITFNPPILEAGWQIYLPPRLQIPIQNDLTLRHGEITHITDTGTLMVTDEIGTQIIFPKDFPQSWQYTNFQKGQCLSILRDSITHKIYSMQFQ